MHKQIALFFGALVYYAVGFYGLYIFETGLLITALVIFGLPAYILARFSAAPAPVLMSIVALGVTMSVVMESSAHIFELWYTPSVETLRILGLVPLEMVFVTMLQTLFLTLLYEFMFDDGQYTPSSGRMRFGAFAVFAIGTIILLWIQQFFFPGVFIEYAYIWLVVVLAGASIAALAVYRTLTVSLFDKLIDFSIIAAGPLLITSFLAAASEHKIFNTETYLGNLSVFEIVIPFEEMLLIFVLPWFVAIIYELYLDDRQ